LYNRKPVSLAIAGVSRSAPLPAVSGATAQLAGADDDGDPDTVRHAVLLVPAAPPVPPTTYSDDSTVDPVNESVSSVADVEESAEAGTVVKSSPPESSAKLTSAVDSRTIGLARAFAWVTSVREKSKKTPG
jgi:hypothetical protein